MKSIAKATFVLVTVLLLFVPSFAGTQRKTGFDLDHPATVAGVKLMPGHYTLKWEPNESKAPVSILKDGRAVASTTASVVNEKNPYHATALDFTTAKNGTRSLARIYLSKEALVFNQKQ